jgi:ATP-binding protein involved in chromosome partitioning
MLLVTTPQPAAQRVAHRAAEMAAKFDLEIAGVVENMSPFTTPNGERVAIFGEGGGQLLADELGVPLLGKVPLEEALRAAADEGRPLVAEDPDAPSAQALLHLARGLVAATPLELPVVQAPAVAAAPGMGGKELPVIQ